MQQNISVAVTLLQVKFRDRYSIASSDSDDRRAQNCTQSVLECDEFATERHHIFVAIVATVPSQVLRQVIRLNSIACFNFF